MQDQLVFTLGQAISLACVLFALGGILALALFSPGKAPKPEARTPEPGRWPVDDRGYPQRRTEDLLRQTHADVRRDRAARGG